jgi:hypothetical protein
MSYSEFVLTVIAMLLGVLVLGQVFGFDEERQKKRREELMSQLKLLEETFANEVMESTQQITGRRYYTDFLSEEKDYHWPHWRGHLNGE